jgi:hypothetical protein
MKIKLCYKEYHCKLNLNAQKKFYEQTKLDISYTLLRYLEACQITKGKSALDRLTYFHSIESFENISVLFKCVIDEESKVDIEEIQDAMFRVSWIPSDRDDDLSEPWPLVVVELATQVNDYFAELSKKKATT